MNPLIANILSLLLAAMVVVAIASCSKNDDSPTESVFDNKVNPPEAAYDFTPELADGSTRYVSPTLTLRYADGGVLAQRFVYGGRNVLRLVELATGVVVELSYVGLLAEGELADAKLEVDAVAVGITAAYARRVNKAGAWIEILAPGDRHYVFVITDL